MQLPQSYRGLLGLHHHAYVHQTTMQLSLARQGRPGLTPSRPRTPESNATILSQIGFSWAYTNTPTYTRQQCNHTQSKDSCNQLPVKHISLSAEQPPPARKIPCCNHPVTKGLPRRPCNHAYPTRVTRLMSPRRPSTTHQAQNENNACRLRLTVSPRRTTPF